jgi:Flp pilus assembly protein TadG
MSSRARSRERGVAAIEFALLLPLLMLILFSIFEFSRGYNARVSVTHAAREGVRAAALGEDHVAAAQGAAGSLNAAQMNISIVGGPPCTLGDPVSVTVSYPVQYTIPFFSSGTWTVSDTGTMRCEVP